MTTPARLRFSWLAALTIVALAGCRGGCGRAPHGAAAAGEALALAPAETRFVLGVDFSKIRAAPAWGAITRALASDPHDKKQVEELTARTGLDPWTQIHRIIAVFPEEARASGRFGIIVDGEGFDERRLVTYAGDQARLQGKELSARALGGHTLWSTGPGAPAGFFLGPNRFVLAGGDWAERMAALADKPGGKASATGNQPLMNLVERVGGGRAFWLAAIVPESTRKALRADPRFDAQASVARLALGGDLGPGLTAQLVADLSNAEDAEALARRARDFLEASKRSPQALILGAAPYLDAITPRAEGPTLRVDLALGEAQTQDLIARLVGLLRLGSGPGGRTP